MKHPSHLALAPLLLSCLLGCSGPASLPVSDGTGPSPRLPAPDKAMFPTVNIAKAAAWQPGAMPKAATGLQVKAFAEGLDHPRWLYVLPNGDVLVAETNAPKRPDEGKGFKGRIQDFVMKRAGAGVASANRITLLRDTDHDGVADERLPFLEGLNSPFGMALVGDAFYVADADALLRFRYTPDGVADTTTREVVAELPGGTRNHHWTKSLIASPDGSKLYVGVGSNSNVAEHGLEIEKERAAILEIDAASGARRIFADGLRNPVGMAWEPASGALWVAVNERDEIGSDLVPDYMTSVKEGGFYGWPWSYYGSHVDERVKPLRPEMVEKALVPDYALGPHTASLGLSSAKGSQLPEPYTQGMFVGQHGSWNRNPRSGYKVIFVPFADGKPVGPPQDVLVDFLDEEAGEARGRPVGVTIDAQGALLVADDVGNRIWRVTANAAAASASPVPVASAPRPVVEAH